MFSNWKWDRDAFQVRAAYDPLADIERCSNFLARHPTADLDLRSVLELANLEGRTKNIHCKFFDVTFYKKGTTHIKFTDQRLLDKFNIYCSQKKGWLPPRSYKVKYEDLGKEEKEVIDDFQGKDGYEAVMNDPGYYLTETEKMLSLPAAG